MRQTTVSCSCESRLPLTKAREDGEGGVSDPAANDQHTAAAATAHSSSSDDYCSPSVCGSSSCCCIIIKSCGGVHIPLRRQATVTSQEHDCLGCWSLFTQIRRLLAFVTCQPDGGVYSTENDDEGCCSCWAWMMVRVDAVNDWWEDLQVAAELNPGTPAFYGFVLLSKAVLLLNCSLYLWDVVSDAVVVVVRA